MTAAQTAGPEPWKLSSHDQSADNRVLKVKGFVQAYLTVGAKGQDPEEYQAGLHGRAWRYIQWQCLTMVPSHLVLQRRLHEQSVPPAPSVTAPHYRHVVPSVASSIPNAQVPPEALDSRSRRSAQVLLPSETSQE